MPYEVMAINVFVTLFTLLISFILLYRKMPEASKHMTPVYKSKEWLRSAFPMLLVGGAQLVISQTDIIMIGVYLDSLDVGFYKVASAASNICTFFLMIVSPAISAYVAKLYENNEARRLQILTTISSIAVFIASLPIVFTMVVYSEELLAFLFGSHKIMPVMAAARMLDGFGLLESRAILVALS